MKVNPNYLGRLFTEQELSVEERGLAVKLPSMRKEKGKLTRMFIDETSSE